MAKSADAFRTISEVADWLGVQTHVLRFWESKFSQIKPVKRAGNRRYYRPNDMTLIGGIQKLVHQDGMTIKGAQKVLREKGVKYVSSLSKPLDIEEENIQDAPTTGDENTVSSIETEAPTKVVAEETSMPIPRSNTGPSQLGFDLAPVTSRITPSLPEKNDSLDAIRALRDEVAEIISRRKASN
jgi:DNA-binding transcriptional MerR regulator